ncbi:stage II sporulation protein M [Amycolatopsis sp. 195334CR]|uniref:stage II sporulation protein M n=1 Tax=Amycolatopsis sp. 195334CR TaxID=2814588 RepID=UPI001A8E7B6A|nr:stage II sporulation protein M [Amycolatopsis sp. 195334CR]MBN6042132.1 stage II sporulation protein M [Amycolatopsis sp. 195334CR]
MKLLRRPVEILRSDSRALVVLTVLIFGALLLGMGTGTLFPGLELPTLVSGGVSGDLVHTMITNPWFFGTVILLINLFVAAVGGILLPSLIVPFLGVPAIALYMFNVGVSIAPSGSTAATVLIPHSLTLIIELTAYVLVMFGAYQLGRGWIRPGYLGESSRRRAYVAGLRRLAWLALPTIVLLVIGAYYEAFSVVYLLPGMLGG